MDYNNVRNAIQTYLDACYEGDAEKMSSIFHNAAHFYQHADDGSLIDWSKDDFIKRIKDRGPAKVPDYPRQDEVLLVDFTGEKSVIVKLKLRIGNNLFTDMLGFMLLEGKWWIISKMATKIVLK